MHNKQAGSRPLTADHLCSTNIHLHGCYTHGAHSQTTAPRSPVVPVVTTIESSFLDHQLFPWSATTIESSFLLALRLL
jgi:hypothetical protein